MATKKQLVDRVEFIKGLIEENGGQFKYNLPKGYKKEDVFEVMNRAQKEYTTITKENK